MAHTITRLRLPASSEFVGRQVDIAEDFSQRADGELPVGMHRHDRIDSIASQHMMAAANPQQDESFALQKAK